jgi:ABC-type bacteriocin/lantibiotic exporter with double-glycine peptidase domain
MAATLAELRRKSRQRRARPIQRVVQQTGTSCGVACVAMLARLSFRDAYAAGLALWGQEYWDESHRTDSSELRQMLAVLGWRLGRQVKCRIWRKVPPDALVAVQWNRSKNTWHWVVSGQDAAGPFFFDPRKNVKAIRRRAFEKARASWYHRVTAL